MLELVINIRSKIRPVSAPVSSNSLTDLNFQQGSGAQVVFAAEDFSGSQLTYSLVTGESVASINPKSGEISIITDDVVSDVPIVVRAENSGGFAETSFHVTILGKVGIGYWVIEDNFIVS